jgi:neurabin
MTDKSNSPAGQKVHAMAHLFQRKATEEEKDVKDSVGTTTVIRTESHAARFNNARALFERLGEGRINNRSTQFSIKHSTSKDDNLKDPSPEREREYQQRSPSPKKSKFVGITNGVNKIESGGINMIQNVSRKSDKPEKPEKPERKFNSKELIEKQKNWTSHFTKSRSAASARCADIIRTVPGTGVINDINNKTPEKTTRSSSIDSPPSPLQRSSSSSTSSSNPPEVKPRTSSRSGSLTSPQKLPDVINASEPECTYALPRKKSLDFHEQQQHSSNSPQPLPPAAFDNRRNSSDKDSSPTSPAHPASPAASSSGPSSPIHTEDEKQENESNEKTESNALLHKNEDNENDKNNYVDDEEEEKEANGE